MEVDICPPTSLQLQNLMTFLNLENIKYTLRGPLFLYGARWLIHLFGAGGYSSSHWTRGGVTPRSFMIYYSKFSPYCPFKSMSYILCKMCVGTSMERVRKTRTGLNWVEYIFTGRVKLQFVCRQDGGQNVFTRPSCENPSTNTAKSSSRCSVTSSFSLISSSLNLKETQ